MKKKGEKGSLNKKRKRDKKKLVLFESISFSMT